MTQCGYCRDGVDETCPNKCPLNQCDGCRRGMPVRNGAHYYADATWNVNLPYMTCSKDRYQKGGENK